MTEADLAKLDSATFKTLWAALGDAFYKSRTALPEPAPAESDEEAVDSQNGQA